MPKRTFVLLTSLFFVTESIVAQEVAGNCESELKAAKLSMALLGRHYPQTLSRLASDDYCLELNALIKSLNGHSPISLLKADLQHR